jgi:hypothetical protein
MARSWHISTSQDAAWRISAKQNSKHRRVQRTSCARCDTPLLPKMPLHPEPAPAAVYTWPPLPPIGLQKCCKHPIHPCRHTIPPSPPGMCMKQAKQVAKSTSNNAAHNPMQLIVDPQQAAQPQHPPLPPLLCNHPSSRWVPSSNPCINTRTQTGTAHNIILD